jgi:ATP-dependent DNA helicase RecG
VTLVYFHARADYLEKTLPEGASRLISGKIAEFDGARQMTHPDYVADPDKPGDMPLHEAVYPLTANLSAAVMRKAVAQAVPRAPLLEEWQDPAWLAVRQWADWKSSLETLHAPQSQEELSAFAPARQRLAYDELLANQLALALIRKSTVKSKGRAIKGDGRLIAAAKKALPFSLTDAQREALKEIFADMRSENRMVRLLQGDVGSGKTIVAFFAMLGAVESGAQAVLMAPTEILARQHLESLSELADATGVCMEVLTGRDKGAARREKLSRLKNGEIDILLGTHALFQDDVIFKDLALVVIDEQHRFGVRQRIALTQKGPKPDFLVMTATPIPRTLALTSYGDMEHSRIAEKPPGRKPVDTRTVSLSRVD